MNHFSQLFLIMVFTLSATISVASDQIGTLTQVQGTVKIFSHPGKTIQGPAPHALFEGEYYSVKDAQVGERVERGNILRTAPGAKARVVFDNGDQFNVGAGTAYRVFWDKDAAKTNTNIQLMYGKLRGVVEKGGPRSKLTIRTRSATMGVRGTDFFIADGGTDGGTEVSILRGAVEVKPQAPAAKPIEVKAGYSAEIPAAPVIAKKPASVANPAPAPASAPVIELRKTTKEDLVAIQKSSQVKPIEAKTELKKEVAISEEVAKKLETLEKKAVETTLKDIKTADPKLFAQIQNKPVKSTDELNTTAVHNLLKTAPKAPEKRKPYKSELEDLEEGAYEKYFKIID